MLWITLPFLLGFLFSFKFFAALINKERRYMLWGVLGAICLSFGMTMIAAGLT